MAALSGKAALFIPGYERYSPDVPSDFDRLRSGYRRVLADRRIGEAPSLYRHVLAPLTLWDSGIP